MKKVIKLTESDLKRIVKRVINEQGTSSIPTGIMDNNEDIILLDKNSSIGILDGEYRLISYNGGFKEYPTTKKIPDNDNNILSLQKNIDGFNVSLFTDNFKIKNENPVGYSWSDLFSKLNKVSINSSNNLLSDEDYIFRSLLNGSVPCFEIDKKRYFTVHINNDNGLINYISLGLKSKCDENIKRVDLELNDNSLQDAVVYTSSGDYYADIVWDGKNLSFPKSKSGESKLIIKVNESIRKVLRRYFL
jgi:hypothetical protein